MPVEEVAESTPAKPEEPAAPETPKPESTDILEPEKTAPAEQKPEETATPGKPESEEKTDESVSAPEAAKRPESKAEARIRQLTAKVKNMERQLSEASQKPVTPPATPVAPTKPKLDQFETVEAYETAIDKWKDDSAKYEASIAVERDRQQRTYQAQQDELARSNQEIASNWQKRVEKTTPQIADLKEAIADAAQGLVPRNDTMDGFILDSDYGPAMLHYLWQNPDEAEKIAAMKPYKCVREMHNLELRIANQVMGINPKASSVTPLKSVAGKTVSPPKAKSLEDLLYG